MPKERPASQLFMEANNLKAQMASVEKSIEDTRNAMKGLGLRRLTKAQADAQLSQFSNQLIEMGRQYNALILRASNQEDNEKRAQSQADRLQGKQDTRALMREDRQEGRQYAEAKEAERQKLAAEKAAQEAQADYDILKNKWGGTEGWDDAMVVSLLKRGKSLTEIEGMLKPAGGSEVDPAKAAEKVNNARADDGTYDLRTLGPEALQAALEGDLTGEAMRAVTMELNRRNPDKIWGRDGGSQTQAPTEAKESARQEMSAWDRNNPGASREARAQKWQEIKGRLGIGGS